MPNETNAAGASADPSIPHIEDLDTPEQEQEFQHHRGLALGLGGQHQWLSTGPKNRVSLNPDRFVPADDTRGRGFGYWVSLGGQTPLVEDWLFFNTFGEVGYTHSQDPNGMQYYVVKPESDFALEEVAGSSSARVGNNEDVERSIFRHTSFRLRPGFNIFPSALTFKEQRMALGFSVGGVVSHNDYQNSGERDNGERRGAYAPITVLGDDKQRLAYPGAQPLGRGFMGGFYVGAAWEVGAFSFNPNWEMQWGGLRSERQSDVEFAMKGAHHYAARLDVRLTPGMLRRSEKTPKPIVSPQPETDPFIDDLEGVPDEPVIVADDEDNDGLDRVLEEALGTDPTNPDSDGDGIFDGVELGDPLGVSPDFDNDGLIDPLDNDDDNDGILTATELADALMPELADVGGVTTDPYWTPMQRDSDGDGKPNHLDTDSDNDGIPDADEPFDGRVAKGNTSTSFDGIPDYIQPETATPLTDSDSDGLADILEPKVGGDINDTDTDDDSLLDFDEYVAGERVVRGHKKPNGHNIDGDTLPDGTPRYNLNDLDSDGDGVPDQDEGLEVDRNKNNIPIFLDPADNVIVRVGENGLPEVKIIGKVYFNSNSSELQTRSHAILDEVAAALRWYPQITQMSIQGHTDSDGTDDTNLVLSQDRAAAVVTYLTQTLPAEKRIDPSRLSSEGFGEAQPIVDNTTEPNKAKNRRVEFVVTASDPDWDLSALQYEE